jgi:hypothetical protein
VANPKYRPHPLVEKLASGSGSSGATRVLGYFGSTADGVVKVYPSLDDLGVCYEIREDDILHVEEASTQELPHGGSVIWVRSQARVEHCVAARTSIEARFLTGRIAARMAKGPPVTYRSMAGVPFEQGGAWDYPGSEYCPGELGTRVWDNCTVVDCFGWGSGGWPCTVAAAFCPGADTAVYGCYHQPSAAGPYCWTYGWTCGLACPSAQVVQCPPHRTGGAVSNCGCQVYSVQLCP